MSLTLLRGAAGGLPELPAHPWNQSPVELGELVEPPSIEAAGRRVLTSEDRAVIAACVRQRVEALERGDRPMSLAAIGALIGRDRSVIGREIARNSGPDGTYYAALAHRQALTQRRRPKKFRLRQNSALCTAIEQWMDQGWSPKLIATILKQDYPHMIMERVSHETIYQALYVQTRGSLRKDLHQKLSTKRPRRQARDGVKRGQSPYREAFKIADRPAEAADRSVPGHWEGDLILGAANRSAIGVLVERTTRFTILLHLPGRHDAESVAEVMIREMSNLPERLRQSLAWDRGVEMVRYERIQLELDMPIYFCDPHAPWQRGTGENTNRLLRHWFEKGTDLSAWSQADLNRVAASLNARPRPTLDLRTPAQALDQLLADLAAA
ncbi:IS30 family transposase [Nocardioides sp. C4-1]|uniref:IS30 family transposase n=1 Tax=Nocardioides sp. C4-1 TaxID=3151851 RepID=UPI003265B42F